MHHPTDRIAHTTAFVTPALEHWQEREIYFINSTLYIYIYIYIYIYFFLVGDDGGWGEAC